MKKIFTSILFVSAVALSAQAQMAITKVGTWNNVRSFSINNAQDYIVMSMVNGEGPSLTEQLYEANKLNGQWQTPSAIDVLNNFNGGTAALGGVFLTSDCSRLYFHANYPNGIGGFDIYYSNLTKQGWSEPQILEAPLNSDADDLNPTLSPGEEIIYFTRRQPLSDAKLEKKEGWKFSVFSAKLTTKGKWNRPLPVANEINKGGVEGLGLANDGVTLFYCSAEDKKDPAELWFARKSIAETWILPELVFEKSNESYCSPRYASQKLFFVKQASKKIAHVGGIYCIDVPDKAQPRGVVNEKGNVKVLGSGRPVKASLTVFDPTSLEVIGKYESRAQDGQFDICSPDKSNYIIDVRNAGYSFASYMVDYKSTKQTHLPQTIELFDTINLSMSIFDSEIFRPLKSKVIAVRVNDKSIFRSKEVEVGTYQFSLPLGSDYNIIATSPNFAENKFLFKLGGDIVFSQFERNLPLTPQKKEVMLLVVDAETQQPLTANVVFDNMKREEKIEFTSVADSKLVALRDGDVYDLTVGGVSGYSFHNRQVDLNSSGNQIKVELIPLRANASIRLNNINFASASADISAESFSELDRVVIMLRENPNLKIEIAAHTDNVGNAAYNKVLSEKRAQSIVTYLIENNIPIESLVSNGYGFSRPLVPNNSEENRAVNRRVEFKILNVDNAQ